MKLTPMGDKIVVKPDTREISSVILVDNKEADNMGTVIAVGPGKKLSNGRREEMPISAGDRIRFGTMSDNANDEYLKFTEYKEDGQRYLIMSWQDVCWSESNV